MRGARSLILVTSCLIFAACSSSGRGGKGSMQDGGLGEGNIPVAQAGDKLADVNFAFDSYALSGNSQRELARHAQWLKSNEDVKVVIEGHCDERGTNEYNMALGERRANATYNYLRNLGVDSGRMSTISYGEELPLDPRSNEAAWAKNRRAHFALKE